MARKALGDQRLQRPGIRQFHDDELAEKQGIALTYIQPGKPQQNAHVERYNRTVRHEWLDLYILETVEEVQQIATGWLWTYNNECPNMGSSGVTPAMNLKSIIQINNYKNHQCC